MPLTFTVSAKGRWRAHTANTTHCRPIPGFDSLLSFQWPATIKVGPKARARCEQVETKPPAETQPEHSCWLQVGARKINVWDMGMELYMVVVDWMADCQIHVRAGRGLVDTCLFTDSNRSRAINKTHCVCLCVRPMVSAPWLKHLALFRRHF